MSFASNLTASCFVVFTAASEPPPFPRPRKQGQVQTKGQPARPLRSPRPRKQGPVQTKGQPARPLRSPRPAKARTGSDEGPAGETPPFPSPRESKDRFRRRASRRDPSVPLAPRKRGEG